MGEKVNKKEKMDKDINSEWQLLDFLHMVHKGRLATKRTKTTFTLGIHLG